MSLFGRRFIRGFLLRTTGFLLLFLWLTILFDLGHGPDLEGVQLLARIVRLLPRHLRALEVASAVSGTLAVVLTILALRRSGVLALFSAAGLRPARITRWIVLAGVLLSMATGTILGLAEWASGEFEQAKTPDVIECHGAFVWRPGASTGGAEAGPLILFRLGDLAVMRGESGSLADGTAEVHGVRSLAGDAFSPGPYRLRRDRTPPLRTNPLRDLIGRDNTPSERLAALCRLLAPAVLVFLAGHLFLLGSMPRLWIAGALTIIAIPAIGFGTLATSVSLWANSSISVSLAMGWILVVLGAIMLLGLGFARRGLRDA